ncbi:MAG TPA: hypothetical protein VER96_20760 [Polyangiaceae bacterium]|nr:hypothetical protein [Polyangiaceae bacterium]
MADIVFSPAPRSPERAPGSAEVLYLRKALFVIRGMFFNPITNADAPLPPHRWALFPTLKTGDVGPPPLDAVTLFSESQTSDEQGFTTVFDNQGMAEADGSAVWELMLIPIFATEGPPEAYAKFKEAWLDVDKNVWLRTTEVNFKTPETRRLLRFPLWSTQRQVDFGGGLPTNPNSPNFATTGLLKTDELKPHGSRSSPWLMQLDQGWFRSHVQLRYYDALAKKEQPIPQGIVLEASARQVFTGTDGKPIPIDSTVGASSVRLDNGAIYVVHRRPESQSQDLVYGFTLDATLDHARFALNTNVIEFVATAEVDLERLGTHYFLPIRWKSADFEAWEGVADASASVRQPFANLRLKGKTPDKPLCFHLDDFVFVDTKGQPMTLPASTPGERVCLFDNLLRIKDPASSADGPLPFSKLVVKQFPLRGEEAVFVRGDDIKTMTRVVEFDGEIFELEERRIFAGDRFVGARSAHPPKVKGIDRFAASPNNSETMLIDTRYMREVHDGKNAKLAHALVYVSCFVTTNKKDDVAGANPATAVLPKVESLLTKAADDWNLKHPASGNTSSPKEYFLVPKTGFKDDSTVLRIRRHFGARTKLARSFGSSNISIEIHPVKGRASGGDTMHLFFGSGEKIYDNMKPADKQAHVPLPGKLSFEPGIDSPSDRLDDAVEKRFTLAHELGHEMGLPDEYLESLSLKNPDLSELSELPKFEDPAPTPKPFSQDKVSMMVDNQLARLRYIWPIRQVLDKDIAPSLDAKHWFNQEKPFVAQYLASKRRLTYDIDSKTNAADRTQPWTPFANLAGAKVVGDATYSLYRLSDDESSVGPMFTDKSAGLLATSFDGILVVESKFWFSCEKDAKNKDTIDLDDQAAAILKFGRPFHFREDAPHFFIQAPAGATEFLRVAVRLCPRFEVDAEPSPTLDIDPSSGNPIVQVIGKANVRVLLRKKLAAPKISSVGGQLSIEAEEDQIGPWLMRVTLDPAARAKPVDNSTLKAADFDAVNRALSLILSPRGLGVVLPF